MLFSCSFIAPFKRVYIYLSKAQFPKQYNSYLQRLLTKRQKDTAQLKTFTFQYLFT
jgi:hypothetical protein